MAMKYAMHFNWLINKREKIPISAETDKTFVKKVHKKRFANPGRD